MIPILFDSGETAFTSNGMGRLSDAIFCRVTEQRNGVYELEMRYPISGIHYRDIQRGRIILSAHAEGDDLQPFDIYMISRPLNGIITINARHISYRLTKSTLLPFEAGSAAEAMAMMPGHIVPTTPFTFWTDKATTGSFNVSAPVSVRSALGGSAGSILDVYGKGDYEFDRFAVKLHLNRGQDSGVIIRYGKNLSDITALVDESEIYAGVVPYWENPESGETVMLGGDDPVVYRSGVDTAHNVLAIGGILIRINADFLGVDRNKAPKIVPLDLSSRFEEPPTETELKAAAEKYLEDNEPWNPRETLKVNFAQLWQTEEYADVAPLQRVKLCDRVGVSVPPLGITVEGIQVVRTVYDVLLERYASMELGTPTVSFGATVQTGTEAGILKTVPTKSTLAAAVSAATDKITGGLGGHLVIGLDGSGLPNELLVMDTADKETAVNVIRINMGGIGFSRSGYNGPFETAWTLDGHFVADYIDTGTLQANIIKAGILSGIQGNSFWNFDTGELYIEASSVGMADGANLQDEFTENFEELNRYIRFRDGKIELGQIQNPFTLILENDEIAFYNGLLKVSFFSDNELFVSNLRVTESAIITGLVVTESEDSVMIDIA